VQSEASDNIARSGEGQRTSPTKMKIQFTFSVQFNTSLTKRDVLYPAKEIEAMNLFWETCGQDIEKILTKITRLSFVEKSIKCYLNSEFSISDPLSLKIENIEDMKDNLIHELIHVLLTGNDFGETSQWKAVMEEYKEEPTATRIHVVVHRIHYLVTQKLFPNRLEAIVNYSKNPKYIRAWNIIKNPEKVDNLMILTKS